MINKEPLVSIVITYYKKKKYIAKTLRSIFDQTYKNFEIIFFDDHSTDNSLKIVNEFIKKNKKIKFNLIKRNFKIKETSGGT